MAVMIVEPHDGYATWLANALSGLTGRAVRVARPDEAMAAVAAKGGAILAALVGPTLSDGDALALAGRLQQGAPNVSVLVIRREETGELLRQALRSESRTCWPRPATRRPPAPRRPGRWRSPGPCAAASPVASPPTPGWGAAPGGW
jgi:DNA-binding NtrC family response regulator